MPLSGVAKPAASGPLSTSDPLVVRVLPDVPAIDKTFDYLVPDAPGYSIDMYPESYAALTWPNGSEWR